LSLPDLVEVIYNKNSFPHISFFFLFFIYGVPAITAECANLGKINSNTRVKTSFKAPYKRYPG